MSIRNKYKHYFISTRHIIQFYIIYRAVSVSQNFDQVLLLLIVVSCVPTTGCVSDHTIFKEFYEQFTIFYDGLQRIRLQKEIIICSYE